MATILDAYGRPVRPSSLTQEIATTSLTSVRTPWYTSVASGLTPERLAIILRAVEQNEILEYLTLAEEMEERDLHYASVLGTRKLAVSGLTVQVEAVSDDAEDVKVAEFCQEVLSAEEAGQLIADEMDALGKGYSVSEIMWDRSEKQWEPRCYEHRDPRFFQFDFDTGRQLRMRDERDPVYGLELEPYKFVQHRPRIKTGLPIRGGLARLAVVAFMCKGYALKDWLAFAEVFGMPLRVGKYGMAATPDQKDALLTAVANIGTDAAAIIPDTMQIEFEAVSNNAGGEKLFGGLAEWLDKQVSKGVLGQTMTSDDGSSLGQAKVHAEVREDIKINDARQLATTLRRDLIRPLVDLNFGPRPNRKYPLLRLAVEEKEDMKVMADALTPFIDRGLRIEASVIRDKFNLPEPEAGAEVLGPAVKPGAEDDGGEEPKKPAPEKKAPEEKPTTKKEEPADDQAEARRALLRKVVSGEALTEDQRRLLALLASAPADDVDRLVEDAPGDALTPVAESVLALARRATSYEDFLAQLDDLQLDASELTEAVAGLTFTARGLGDATDDPSTPVVLRRLAKALTAFNPNQPRQGDGKWKPGGGGGGGLAQSDFPPAGKQVSGLDVGNEVHNQDSIGASLNDYEVLKGIREVPMSAFESTNPYDMYYSKSDHDRVRSLAAQIKANNRIDPLIVVVDDKGVYVLEGGHRLAALHTLGVKSLPAMVVRDLEALNKAKLRWQKALGQFNPAQPRAGNGKWKPTGGGGGSVSLTGDEKVALDAAVGMALDAEEDDKVANLLDDAHGDMIAGRPFGTVKGKQLLGDAVADYATAASAHDDPEMTAAAKGALKKVQANPVEGQLPNGLPTLKKTREVNAEMKAPDAPAPTATQVNPKLLGKPGSSAHMFKTLIAEGKLSDAEIFKQVQEKFGLSDDKKNYVNWYRNDMKKKGIIPGGSGLPPKPKTPKAEKPAASGATPKVPVYDASGKPIPGNVQVSEQPQSSHPIYDPQTGALTGYKMTVPKGGPPDTDPIIDKNGLVVGHKPRPPKPSKIKVSEEEVHSTTYDVEKWNKSLTSEEKHAWGSWKGTGYSHMRAVESGQVKDEHTTKKIELLKKALDKAPPHHGTLFRGMRSLSEDQALQMTTVGAVLEQPAMSSWSPNASVAAGFTSTSSGKSYSVTLRLRHNSGVAKMVDLGAESEAIIPKGVKMKVVRAAKLVKDGQHGNRYIVDVEEVP